MEKDLLSLEKLTSGDIMGLLELSSETKANPEKHLSSLKGKILAVVFEKPSLRTRVTFETGIYQLGGHPIYLAPADIKLGERESVKDVARNLERWVDFIAARTFKHATVEGLAANCDIPVINALSDRFHPCQALADLLTLKEKKGELKGLKVAFVGDSNNVAYSLMIGAAKCGTSLTLVHPEGYGPDRKILEFAIGEGKKTGSSITATTSIDEGVRDADAVYTDVWVSMGQEAEREKRLRDFKEYQVNSRVFSLAKKEAVFLHCLPAHRGEEVTEEVADGDRSVIYDQAENRLHTTKAILLGVGPS